MNIILIVVLSILCFSSAGADTAAQYEANIKFYRFKENSISNFVVSSFNKTMVEEGCDLKENFAVIAHGWREGFLLGTGWVNSTILNLLKFRGGCVFFMDYSKYANVGDYFQLTPHFAGISAVLQKKFKQIGNYDRQYCFGFSFGSWLCSDAGTKIGTQLIDKMDLCDPAGYGFDLRTDVTVAAKNVACIHTSTDKGTSVYGCHQNFRMGYCGQWQLAAGPYPLGSHGLCPYLYNLAFENNFTPTNTYGCTSNRLAKNLDKNVKMGYMGNFNRTSVRGDIFIATARYPNYLVINGTLENKKPVV